jgi:hypothetical protein
MLPEASLAGGRCLASHVESVMCDLDHYFKDGS